MAMAQVPRMLPYQGRLTDIDDTPINGSVDITYRLFRNSDPAMDAPGDTLWEELRPVSLINGYFEVTLGITEPLDIPFDAQYWIELQVGTETIVPREALVSSPYSIRSIVSSRADSVIQSVSSSAHPVGRMGHMRFVPGTDCEITESAVHDTIYISIGSTGGGGPSGGCTVAPSVPAEPVGETLVCSGQSAVYSVNNVDCATNYNWSIPSGAFITSGYGTNSVVVRFGSTGGNISVSASNSIGTSASSTSLAVSITNAPSAPTAISGDVNSCSGETGLVLLLLPFRVQQVMTGLFRWVPQSLPVLEPNQSRSIWVPFREQFAQRQ
jgi:hypothetical protein